MSPLPGNELSRRFTHRHTWRVNQTSTRISAAALGLAGALLLAACSADANASEPGPNAGGNGFCSAMLAATEAAPRASEALNALFDEMENPDYLKAGTDIAPLTAAGEALVLAGNTYITTLETAQDAAPAEVAADFDAIIDYWKLYGVALGDYAADSADYIAYVDRARPLIESQTSADLQDAQRSAAATVSSAYADACSNG